MSKNDMAEELIPVLYSNSQGVEMVKFVKRPYTLASGETILSAELFLKRLKFADAWGDGKDQDFEQKNPLCRTNRQVDKRIDEIISQNY